MKNNRFFEVKGPDGEYRPREGEVVPPTVASDSMYPQLILLAGVGFMLVIAREHDQRINTLLMRGSPIHDFIGLMLIFFSASYLTLLLPEEWNMMVILGTLITYYTLINLHGERTREW